MFSPRCFEQVFGGLSIWQVGFLIRISDLRIKFLRFWT